MRELLSERESLLAASRVAGGPPRIDLDTVMKYRRDAQKLFQAGKIKERKQFLRTVVQEVRLMPEELTVEIQYRVPQAVMNGLVAGGGFEPVWSGNRNMDESGGFAGSDFRTRRAQIQQISNSV
jgi:hypothetical protein